jgi:hypothetical protein
MAAGVLAAGCAAALVACTAAAPGTQAGAAATGAASEPVPKRSPALAEAALEKPKLVVRLTGVERTGPEVLTLSFVVSNPDPAGSVQIGAAFADAESEAGSMAGAFVFDEAHRKKYFVLRGDQDRPVCSQVTEPIPAGQELAMWCRFPAPPATVGVVSVGVPGLPLFRDVPVSGAAQGGPAR